MSHARSVHKRTQAAIIGKALAVEYLRQRSLLQAGERDLGARAIRNKLSAIQLESTLGLLRADWRISDRDQLAMLYAAERGEGDDLPALQRALASASQRQHFNEEFDQGLLHYTRVISPTICSSLSRCATSRSKSATPF